MPTRVTLNGASASEDNYYAVGNNGTVLTMKRLSSNDATPQHINPLQVTVKSFPNPAIDMVNIQIPDSDSTVEGIISVTDSKGNIVLMEKISSSELDNGYSINTSRLSNGLHLIKITNGGNLKATGKFLVMH